MRWYQIAAPKICQPSPDKANEYESEKTKLTFKTRMLKKIRKTQLLGTISFIRFFLLILNVSIGRKVVGNHSGVNPNFVSIYKVQLN